MSAESNQHEVGVLTSKVVQINAVQVGQEHETYTDRFVVLYAVCEDGSVWQRTQLLVDNRQFHADGPWRMVQPPIDAVRQAIWAGNEIMETETPPKPQDPCPFQVGDIIIFSNPKGTLQKQWRVDEVRDDWFERAEVDGDEWNKVYRRDWWQYKIVKWG